MAAYYNEIDPFAAAWLRALIADGQIAEGVVDERSIIDVRAEDLAGFTQCHFFAGIGGWSLALRLAGWDDARSVWTGSCPCQPWSVAGLGRGADDPRHLWPAWFSLIRERRPVTVFGEQTASRDGEYWLDLVSAGMESEDYAIGTLDLPAGGIGAPQRRQRFVFVADDNRERRRRRGATRLHAHRPPGHDADGRGAAGILAGPSGERQQARTKAAAVKPLRPKPDVRGGVGGATSARLEGLAERGTPRPEGQGGPSQRASALGDFWADADWLPCRDGKARPVEPGTFPLADGVPARVGRLRGYGNAIVPQLAAQVIAAYMEFSA